MDRECENELKWVMWEPAAVVFWPPEGLCQGLVSSKATARLLNAFLWPAGRKREVFWQGGGAEYIINNGSNSLSAVFGNKSILGVLDLHVGSILVAFGPLLGTLADLRIRK